MSAILRVLVLSAAVSSFAAPVDGELTAAAAPVSVDLRTGRVLGVLGTANLRYSPGWAAENASVRIEAVAGTTTNVVKTGGLNEDGVFVWTQPNADTPVYRLLLWTLADGVPVGEPLSAFVSFGFQSAVDEAATVKVDTRADSLRLAAEAGDKIKLAYSTAWAEDSSSVAISAIKLTARGGVEVSTNTVFSAVADAEGVTDMTGVEPGYWKLLYRAMDSSGGVLLEYVTGDFKRKCGFMFVVR